MTITAILTSHNRRAQTLACLASFFGQEAGASVRLDAVLVDDGSADGTARAVREQFPKTDVIEGTGCLFWAGGMALAEQVALSRRPNYLLWLNDDVVLDPDALSKLLETEQDRKPECIVVGAVRDPATGEVTYSGVRRRGLHPLRVALVSPTNEPIEVETFNGNVVLVPREAAARVGALDGAFVHGAADFDYGLRALKKRITNILAPGTVGTCAASHTQAPWLDRSVPPRERLRLLVGPKGRPPRSRARYLMRHGGPAWPVFWLASYLRAAPAILRPSRSGRAAR